MHIEIDDDAAIIEAEEHAFRPAWSYVSYEDARHLGLRRPFPADARPDASPMNPRRRFSPGGMGPCELRIPMQIDEKQAVGRRCEESFASGRRSTHGPFDLDQQPGVGNSEPSPTERPRDAPLCTKMA